MKKLSLLLCGCMVHLLLFAQTPKPTLAIIPEPVKVTQKAGQFILPHNLVIEASIKGDEASVVTYLKRKLATSAGSFITIKSVAPTAAIRLIINKKTDTLIKTEGYRLSVTPKKVIIRANDAAGLFYGVQTFIQLLPKEVESNELVKGIKWAAPAVEITDYPRFAWRGLMFDVSRHFFTKAEVKIYIDQMVKYKLNLLHLHLTDDNGWRVEIKSLPKLTTVGAYSVKRVGEYGTFSPVTPDEPRDYGGYYTQDDIKELVQYAKDRFVDIMPEIDVPGHSLAAVASYPELSCTPGADKYHVSSGEARDSDDPDKRVPTDNTLCPANENVYVFLDKVVTEIAQLFPFDYIHMGGDECNKEFWKKSDAVKALMQTQNLKNMDEVQSYFEKRLEKIVESKGKKFMGWDEIVDGGLGPHAAVMSWRSIQGGITAARLGHEVVMSPTSYTYLDYMQSDRVNEPHVYESLRLNKVYSFEPVPDSVDSRLIRGAQANLWTEQVFNIRQAEYMTWPRGMALAELVWSPKEKKNWNTFFGKVEQHFARFDEAEIKYAPSAYDPSFSAVRNPDKTLKITLATEVEGLDIYYSFDNSFPDRFYPKYTGPIDAPKDATQLRVITYRGKKPIGRMVTMPIAELRSRLD